MSTIETKNTDLEPVTTAIVEFDRVAAGIDELQRKYTGVVYEVTTTAGMTAAREARAAIREPRYEVEKVRKNAKAPIIDLARKIDTRAAQITKDLLAIETPIDQQIKHEEDRKEAERQAKIAAEKKRVDDIQALIVKIAGWPMQAANKSSTIIESLLRTAKEFNVEETRFMEFTARASETLAASQEALTNMLAERQAYEIEQRRLAEERAELERLRTEQEERERIAQAARDEQARKDKAERDAEAARLKAIQDDLDRQECEAKAKREEEERTLQLERDRIAALQLQQQQERDQLAAERAAQALERESWSQPQEAPSAIITEQSKPRIMARRPTADDIIRLVAQSYAMTEDEARALLISLRFGAVEVAA